MSKVDIYSESSSSLISSEPLSGLSDISVTSENDQNSDSSNKKYLRKNTDEISLKNKRIYKENNSFDNIKDGELYSFEYIENESIGKYKIIKILGKGSSSKVVLGLNTKTQKEVAIKIVKRNNTSGISEKRFYREVVISTLLEHPNIARLIDFLYTSSHFFIVFEYIKGKQLYDVVIKKGFLDEKEAARYFNQILSALDYLHRNSIVHRDLKIENILIDENNNIKIIDFGLSNFYDNKSLLSTFCGSLYFAAPELLLGQRYCGPEIDIWSLGIILYVILCGKVPFDDENIHSLQEKIKKCKFTFYRQISADAKDLITNLITVNPSGRFGIEQIKKSSWINNNSQEVNNYMKKRYPINKIDYSILNILNITLSFQFTDIENDIKNYINICKNDIGSLEQIYWSKKPIISLYYLINEKINNVKNKGIEKIQNIEKIKIYENKDVVIKNHLLKKKEYL